MVSTIKIDIPSRGTQAEIDALPTAGMAFVPAGSRIFNTTTGVMNTVLFPLVAPDPAAWTVDTIPGGANRVLYNDANGDITSSDNLTSDVAITINGSPFDTQIKTSTDALRGGIAMECYNFSASAKPQIITARGRGTKLAPLANLDNDITFNWIFAGTDSNNFLRQGAGMNASVDGTVSATAVPIKLEWYAQNFDLGTLALFYIRPSGLARLAALGGTTREIEINFREKLNLITDNFLLNGLDPFDPIFLSAGYASPVSTGNPSFTAPISIAYSAKAEGTWTKVSGMGLINSNGNISFAAGTATTNVAGNYSVSLSVCGEVDSASDRVSLYSIAIDETDTDKVLADLTPNASASESDSSNWVALSANRVYTLAAGATIKVFYAQLNESGSVVDDVNIGIIELCIKKIGLNG